LIYNDLRFCVFIEVLFVPKMGPLSMLSGENPLPKTMLKFLNLEP
jgi:hypothetical protein